MTRGGINVDEDNGQVASSDDETVAGTPDWSVGVADAGRFSVHLHFRNPTLHPEDDHDQIQIGIPTVGAAYDMQLQSATGRTLRHGFGPRDVVAIASGQPHVIDWRRPAELVSVMFTPAFLSEALNVLRLELHDSLAMRDPFVFTLAAQIGDVLRNGDPVGRPLMEAYATILAHRLGVEAGHDRSGLFAGVNVSRLSPEQVRQVVEYMDARLDAEVTLAELASILDLSLWHFMKRFKRTTGLPPHEFLVERRFTRARHLLERSGLSVTEVALEVGMSLSHFSRRFARRFGITPSDYRSARRGR